ncbi:hypothetical protein [Cesiribacter sp. SM1]|uniref:hypothetical protein n=1 Tax=Cesiribacter sp. SM1 TaxID=2861196 RepID=UPI001CD1DE2A|nr:hypothetical protein [Cesiribacter sp. SM1]
MKYILKFSLLLCFCLAACEFTPDGRHYEEVDPTVVVSGNIDLNLAADTVFIQGNVSLKYNVALPGKTLVSTRLLLGERLLKESHLHVDGFNFISTNYSNGTYQLKLEATANSGTGSLADVMGAEGIVVQKTWVLIIHNGPPPAVPVTNIFERDGQLVIQWEKYKLPNFREYRLLKEGGGGSKSIVITNQNTTEWIDSSYVGNLKFYILTVVDQSNKESPDPQRRSFNASVPAIINAYYNDDTTISISYSTTKFRNNLNQYKIRRDADYQTDLVTSSDPLNTVAVVPFNGFGAETEYHLITEPKPGALYTGYEQRSFKVQYGWAFKSYKDFHYGKSANAYYGVVDNKVVMRDGASLNIQRQKEFTTNYLTASLRLAVSPDGKQIYATRYPYIWQLDPATLEVLHTYAISYITGEASSDVSSFTVSNNGRLAIQERRSYYTYYYIYDFQSSKLLLKQQTNNSSEEAGISQDGNVFYHSERLHVYNGANWEVLYSPVRKDHIAYHPSEPWVIVFEDQTTSVYSTTNGTKLTEFSTSLPLSDIMIDPATGYLGGHSHEFYHLYDLSSGKQIRKIKIIEQSSISLLNNRLFSNDRYLPLQ